ncbi:hypothetical protein MBORA_15730 [Methanobrevibacter oralis]|uniref:Uncharacterized protein n=1 Tax=Methanobrevibacter oralis TaxID=66851 RepID=A0A165ZYF4_METOA|nr:hypothetical protein [Methanobrevibacter oralis]KZX11328.1 hypothetical protein MBORA_15730 [Methanobrevibacter oralis]
MSLHKIKENSFVEEYFQSPSSQEDISYKESIMEYDRFFDKKFDELYDHFLVLNNTELKEFIKSHDDLLLLIDKINPLLKKIFPNFVYILDFNQDPEFQYLNQVVIYIHIGQSSFDENWALLRQLNKEIINIGEFPSQLKRLLSVDLW